MAKLPSCNLSVHFFSSRVEAGFLLFVASHMHLPFEIVCIDRCLYYTFHSVRGLPAPYSPADSPCIPMHFSQWGGIFVTSAEIDDLRGMDNGERVIGRQDCNEGIIQYDWLSAD